VLERRKLADVARVRDRGPARTFDLRGDVELLLRSSDGRDLCAVTRERQRDAGSDAAAAAAPR